MAAKTSLHSDDQETNDHDKTQEPEPVFDPKSLKFWTITASVYLAFLLIGLDRTIIATAIPTITDEFDSIADIGWYGSAYMLTCACFFPVFGRVYQIYSRKWSFLVSILIFEIGSTLCGAAPNSSTFISGRAIAGLGSAGIVCGGMMVILSLVPLHKRPVFNAIFGLAFGVSSVLGPIVGGLLTEHVYVTFQYSPRSIFAN
jgi:MFS family permease